MGLKSLIGKIVPINGAVNYSDVKKNVIYEKYPSKNDFQSSKKLEEIFNNSVQYTKDQQLKLGLEIILTLISHKNENIKAYALGRIYFLIDDENIQEIIINELKNMSDNRNYDFNESIQRSLDLFTWEVHKFVIIDIIFDLLAELTGKIKYKLSRSKFSLNLPYSDIFFSTDMLEIRNKNEIFYLDNSLNVVLRIFRIINRRICRMIPYFEEIQYIDYENLIIQKMTQYNHTSKLEFSEEGSLQRLASFYAKTFMERGHMRRLIALLDDDDDKVQKIGVNALTELINFLLNTSNEKKLIKSHSDSHMDKFSHYRTNYSGISYF